MNMITIIIVIYNTDKKKLKLVLNKIHNDIPIIFVINSHNYNFDDLQISQKYTLLNCRNEGNGAAINLALKEVKTKFSIYMDIDIFFEENFFNQIIDIANKISDFAILVPNHGNINSDNDIVEKYDGESAVMFFNMSKLDRIGYFDENFFLYYEEADLLSRCRHVNEKVYFLTKIKIEHFRATSIIDETNTLQNLRSWHYMWSMFYFYKKNFNYLYAIKKTYKLLFYDVVKLVLSIVCFNSKSIKSRYYRIWGLISSMVLKKSFLRPK